MTDSKHSAAPTEAKAVELAFPKLVKAFGATDVGEPGRYHAILFNGIWHVYGRLPAETIGGTPELDLCQSSGDVIAIFHSQ